MQANEPEDHFAGLFDAMRVKEAEAMRALFSAEGQLAATQRRNGQPSVRVYNGEAFAKLIVETKGVVFCVLQESEQDRDFDDTRRMKPSIAVDLE